MNQLRHWTRDTDNFCYISKWGSSYDTITIAMKTCRTKLSFACCFGFTCSLVLMTGTKTVQYLFGCYAQQECTQDKYPGQFFKDNMFA